MKKLLSILLTSIMLLGVCLSVSAITDGTYTGEAMGNNDLIQAAVTFAGDKITAIDATHIETPGLGDVAIMKLTDAIISNQSVKVDVISGATNTSYGFINAVGEAIRAAGSELDAFMGEVSAPDAAPATDMSCDVVVLGAGGAGMSAALTAVEQGAGSVIIVEKMSTTGGNTVRSTGGMNAADTPEQDLVEFAEAAGVERTLASAKETYGEALGDLIATVEQQWADYQAAPEGYFDSVELFMLDTLVGGRNLNDHALVNVLASQSASGIAWLQSINANLESVGSFGGASVKRIHRPLNDQGQTVSVGGYLVPILTQNSEASDAITILFDTKANEIVMTDGNATGIKVENASGSFTIDAKAVVIATGGFGANEEMYVSYNPGLAGFVTTNAPGAMGEGIAMGQAVGADTVDMDQIQIHPTVEQATSALITEGLRGDGAIMINQEGNRFCDEVGTRDVVSAQVIEQTGSYAYLIVDQKMVDASSVIAGYIKSGLTTEGETIEALATAIDSDPDTLVATMNTWNDALAAGNDAEFGRTSFANALDTAPFFAIKIAPGVHHTMGGLKINTVCEVIDTQGNAIPGLFAAGEVAGGIHGANRLGGNAVADIIVFGRIAGQSAAEFAK